MLSPSTAIRALGECLRQELSLDGDHDIHVSTIMPAAFDTPLFQQAANYTGRAVRAMPPVYPAEKVAKTIVRCARRPRREVLVGNSARMASSQFTMAPGLAERMFAKAVDRQHLQDSPAQPTPGNVFEPMPEWTGVGGGWRTDSGGSARWPWQLIECSLTGPTVRMGERYVFQHDALGGATPEEFHKGSERVEEYLARYGSHRLRWPSPENDADRPEAEWGFEPALREDVQRFARERGYRVRRVIFEEPEHLSPLVADLYRRWYRERRIISNRLLVGSFIVHEPYWARGRCPGG